MSFKLSFDTDNDWFSRGAGTPKTRYTRGGWSIQPPFLFGGDMPRIYDAASDPWDFCRDCFPDEATAEEEYGDNLEEKNQGPDKRGNCFGYDAEHPSYGGEDYKCHGKFKDGCGKLLTDKDNEP